ncbi:MAG TPA: 8-amino-7-oxononanoate synthase [Polyangiaceae bacterium]
MSRSALRHLEGELAALARAGLLRDRPPPVDRIPGGLLHLCSNDYLGYRSSRRLEPYARAAAAEHPAGAGASRLVLGEHRAHEELEASLAAWLNAEDSLVFTSGYTANVGTIAALAQPGDLVVSDALNHASIIDGCRLSRAQVEVVAHRSIEDVHRVLRSSTARRRWVITESYFSMEGDSPDLSALREVCDEWDAALVVDEAHAMGVFGREGQGRAHEEGVRADVLVGTLGKALGTQGAFVAGSRDLCRWLWNRARSFVFSTGLSPLLACIARSAVDEARGDERGRRELSAVASRLRAGLAGLGIETANTRGPILPIIMGTEARALAWSLALEKQGVLIQAIRPPTVPPGTSRLRLTARADLNAFDVERALDAFARLAKEQR